MSVQNLSVTNAVDCVSCTNPNGTIGFGNLTLSSKGFSSGSWYWSFSAPRCFYAPYYPQGYINASATLRCDSETGGWMFYVQAQALLSYLQDIPNCPYSPWAPYQQATCYFGWEGAVNVGVDGDGKFQGEVEVPLNFLFGSGVGCCGGSCTLTFKFN